jgi:glycosyltransferase involved in cell wall biosynthesis
MKKISIMTPCFNEAENVEKLINKIREVMATFPDYDYEHIFIDNSSKDRTVDILKEFARKDRRIKIIVNRRNFGHIRSPFYGLMQAGGDCAISLVADLQDPPELIADFIRKWEEGYKVVVGIKTGSKEHPVMYWLRDCYYRLIARLSDVEMIPQFTGFGLYDRDVIDTLRGLNEPYPYFRGLIADIGFELARIEYIQPKRKHGKTKNSFYTLFDMALLGLTNHTKIPLRLATLIGFFGSLLSGLLGVVYVVYKLFFWDRLAVGIAPLVVGLFFVGSIQLFFLGVIGEYIGAIYTYSQNRPLVIEKERVNFDDKAN